jgi:hypothetical protein
MFVLFVGHPRSGHSLVGSLIDAHRNAVIAHELDVLRLVQVGFRRTQIYSLILERDRAFTDAGRSWSGYGYEIPGEWQGRFDRLEVIGDKKGGKSSHRIALHPHLLDRLQVIVGVPVQVVHVVRNPFDNAATIAHRLGEPLERGVDLYLRFLRGIAETEGRLPESSISHVRLESLIADPRGTLGDLCGSLGLVPDPGYLDHCASIIFPSPHRTRDAAQWNNRLTDEVSEAIQTYPFLSGYSLDT